MATSQKIFINGPVHRCEVKLVTPRYLANTFADFGEKVYGCYDAKSNKIYLDKTLNSEQIIQVFLHELSHMLDHQMEGFHAEQRADAYATFALKFYNVTSLQQLLGTKK